MFRNQYDNDNTTWSPQGRLLQVEYAMEAVKQGSVALGLVSATHAVLVALRRSPGDLASYQKKLLPIDQHVGMAIAGLTSDARVLNTFMQSEALNERVTFGRPLSLFRLATSIADKAQANTQQYGGRPYGVGVLLAGVDETGPHLYEVNPMGHLTEWSAMAIGARSQPCRTYFEKQVGALATASLQDLVLHGLQALQETLQQGAPALNAQNTSIAVVGSDMPFSILSEEEIDVYLKVWKETLPAAASSSTTSSGGAEAASDAPAMDVE